MAIAAIMKAAPAQKRQSWCMRLQYGPGSGSPMLLLLPSWLCLLPVIFEYLCLEVVWLYTALAAFD